MFINSRCILLTILLLSVLSFSLRAETVPLAHASSIKSEVMQEVRRYSVYLPPSYHSDKAQQSSYPVIYLLDGDKHRLLGIAGMVESLSTQTLEQQIHEAIIVAIPNSDAAIRERDLTPTNVDWTFKEQVLERFENIGNADNFIKFFEQELIPEINAQYRTSNKRIVVGESFGGLFAAHTLLTKPKLFSDYLIIDATYLWDKNYLNRTYDSLNFNKQVLNANVYLAFANNQAFGEIGETNLQWGQSFAKKLGQNASLTFQLKSQYFAHESHGTVALLSWYHGLRWLLANEGNK